MKTSSDVKETFRTSIYEKSVVIKIRNTDYEYYLDNKICELLNRTDIDKFESCLNEIKNNYSKSHLLY